MISTLRLMLILILRIPLRLWLLIAPATHGHIHIRRPATSNDRTAIILTLVRILPLAVSVQLNYVIRTVKWLLTAIRLHPLSFMQSLFWFIT